MIFPHQEKHAGRHDYKRDKNPNISKGDDYKKIMA